MFCCLLVSCLRQQRPGIGGRRWSGGGGGGKCSLRAEGEQSESRSGVGVKSRDHAGMFLKPRKDLPVESYFP